MYQGSSIVDYLNNTGQKSDYASRAKLAASKGIQGYTGSAQQNTQLLNMLRGSGVSATPPAPSAPTNIPSSTPASVATPQPQMAGVPVDGGVGFDSNALTEALVSKGYNRIDAQNAANGPRATELAREYLGVGNQGSVGANTLVQPSINLPDLYNEFYSQSGVNEIETQLSDRTRAYTDAVSKINDNPYYSEATRVGKLRKLEEAFNMDTANLRSDIATKKADIETRLNLQTKQFDINNEQTRNAVANFNNLLQLGAYDNASGDVIADITRATGIPSSAIMSAIKSRNDSKNKRETQLIQVDDGKNIKAVVIDPATGDIINETVISASKPSGGGASKEAEIGSSKYSAQATSALNQFVSGRANNYGHLSPSDWAAALNAFLADALGTKEDFVKAYASYTDPYRGDFQTAYGFSKQKREDITQEYN